MTGPEVGLDEQSQYLNEAAQGIAERVPAGWSTAEFKYVAAAGTSSYRVNVTMSDGTDVETNDVPLTVVRAMSRLRRAMHDEHQGTWFTATITVDQSGRYKTDFEYDSEPHFPVAISPKSFVEDLERFPRDEENIPPWLQEKLHEANES
ncbi:DUF600 family protein [Saccharopolyspora sp. TS4A08]|uniref:DUF600 family protein n=1 Tax=Saccharopolyspora ipomoeae TaxID=3042027 RepID=A0ABT6PS55_9PSEU|nr:immunity protein YezG family protein [Saccharopolyspora sp. TS4A08]MDI2030842.1 DUF600 family protein [Saccharopolyspora sp. TS4A08]